MTDVMFIDDDAEDERVQSQSADLAVQMEQTIVGLEASVVLLACCWLMASLILQAEKQVSTMKAIEIIARQLVLCVTKLRERFTPPQIH